MSGRERWKQRLKKEGFLFSCYRRYGEPVRQRLAAEWAWRSACWQRRRRPLLTLAQESWNGPLLSVIVTCYNYGRYLDRVLASLARQSWRNFETILIDDGSSDPFTREYLARLESSPPPGVTLIRQSNRGVIAARNRAIAQARGRYIFPLDADDTIADTFLEKCLFLLENSPADSFAYSWTLSCGEREFVWPTRASPPAPVLRENRIGFILFRKSAFELVGGYNPMMAEGYEDWELGVNLVAHGFCGRVVCEPLYHYEVKPGSRNRQANRRHERLQRLIYGLHGPALEGRWPLLCRLVRQPCRVVDSLENLLAGPPPAGASLLLDLRRPFRPRLTRRLLTAVAYWAASRNETILLLMDRPRPDFFWLPRPANLRLYFPAGYHPLGDPEPFIRYLERRYRPQRVDWKKIRTA